MATPKHTPQSADMNTLVACLEDIASTTKTKEKESLLRFYLGYTPMQQVVIAMLNPYWKFGITSFTPASVVVNEPATIYELLELLDELRQRKLTGNAAREAAGVFVKRGVPEALMIRLLEKDPKAGFNTTMVNKVLPGLLPEFPYMRCSLEEKSNMKKWDWSVGIYSQLKDDGMFMNVDIDFAQQVTLSSRQGQIFPEQGFEEFHNAVRRFLKPGTQSHGEMTLIRDGKVLSRMEGNGIINSVAQGGSWEGCTPRYRPWDQIPLDAVQPKAKYSIPYKQRLNLLGEQLYHAGPTDMVQLIPGKIVYSKQEAYQDFADRVGNGEEGTVVKHPDMIWADGTSKDQVKMKLEFVVDLEIVGYTKGNGKFADTFGAIQTRSKDKLLEVDVSGMDDATRKRVSDAREEYIGTILAVEANAVNHPSKSNPKYSLSHPRAHEFRLLKDKDCADTLAEILEQQAAAIRNAALMK